MAHRDEVEALRVRIEAQERDLRDAKAELEGLLSAARANAAAAHEPTQDGGPFMGFGGPNAGAHAPLRAETQRRVGLLVLLITTMVAALFVSTSNCPSRHRVAAAPAEVRFARVVSPGVPAAVAATDACAVEISAEAGTTYDCRVVVRCGDNVLYGSTPNTGYNRCGASPSRITDAHVSRDDGDPALDIDLASGSVVVIERVGLGFQRVELLIED